jgi:hypothetical protein
MAKETKKPVLPKYAATTFTTDEEELKLRRQRGAKEPMQVTSLGSYPTPFDNYLVRSGTSLEYTVEIRSLSEPCNSCSCPDFQVNHLGTCKHIEKVLYTLKKEEDSYGQKNNSSSLVEIFFDNTCSGEVKVVWPEESSKDSQLTEAFKPLFSSDNILLPDLIPGFASIEHALEELPEEVKAKIRISSHLVSKVKDRLASFSHNMTREQFLQEVDEGKRSMNMLSVNLYPYQEEGMLHLAFKRRALLADEMGLGKTIQAIAACELLRRLHNIQKVVVICPASLKGEWEDQIAKFTNLPTLIVQGTRPDRLASYIKPSFFYLMNYEQVRNDFSEIQHFLNPDVIILDEAQRIKNWQTKTAWAVKQLKSPYAFILTGTPIENRIDELFSIMQMVDPHVLGPMHQFHRQYFTFDEKNKPIGYQKLNELREKVQPALLRRLKKDVEEQLPERTVNNFFVEMAPEQHLRYDEYQDCVARLLSHMKRRPLTEDEQKKLQQYLACMRMIADTPYILDPECRVCPKLDELRQLLSELVQTPENKIIIFSEWEGMLSLIRELVEGELQIDFAWHTGSVPQQKRREDIRRFKEDPNCKFFLTTDSGSTGLNLQVANVVINMDLPWNPAKLEQRIASAWRKNQTRVVQVINFISLNTIEHRMLATLDHKKNLADGILDGVGEMSSMPLTSARKELLGDLAGLFGKSHEEDLFVEEDSDEMPVVEKRELEDIAKEAVTQFNDRVQSIEEFKNSTTGMKTVLARVDTLDRNIIPEMEKIFSPEKVAEQNVQLELIDKKTHELLQRLAKLGIITIHDAQKPLHQSMDAIESSRAEREKRLQEAKKIFTNSERKQKMAELLSSGDFFVEALAPMAEAVSYGIKSHSILTKQEHAEAKKLYRSLLDSHEELADSPLGEKQAQSLFEEAKQFLDLCASEMVKFSLL